MPNPPENLPEPETNLTPADKEPASVADTADFAKRLEQYQTETRRRKRVILKHIGAFSMGLPFFILCFYMAFINNSYIMPKFILYSSILGVAVAFVASFFDLFTQPPTSTIGLIEKCNLQAIGPLLDRFDLVSHGEERELISQTITNLLQRIQPDQAKALPRAVRIRLNRRLTNIWRSNKCTSEQVEFCLAWLKVLEQIGDRQDFMMVLLLANGFVTGQSYNTIREAAQECLPHIEARIDTQKQNSTLLRASALEADGGETLLRAAAQSNPTAPKELLRPAEPEEDSGDL